MNSLYSLHIKEEIATFADDTPLLYSILTQKTTYQTTLNTTKLFCFLGSKKGYVISMKRNASIWFLPTRPLGGQTPFR
jgi:hypothetical protein